MTIRSPFQQAAHGRLKMYTEDQMSAQLLSLPPEGVDCVHRVELLKLAWSYPHDVHDDDIGEAWAITGLDAAVPKVVVVADADAARAPAPGDAPPVEDAGFDILADLEAEDCRARKRQRAAGIGLKPIVLAIAEEVDELGQAMADMLDCGADAAELVALHAEEDAEDPELQEEEGEGPGGASDDLEVAAAAEGAEPGEDAPEAPVDDYQVFLDSLSCELLANDNVQDKASGLPVGTIRKSFRDGSVKATCKKGHNKCVCWIKVPDGEGMDRQVHMDLLRWLDEGNRGADEQSHWRSSLALRRDKYGMKVRA